MEGDGGTYGFSEIKIIVIAKKQKNTFGVCVWLFSGLDRVQRIGGKRAKVRYLRQLYHSTVVHPDVGVISTDRHQLRLLRIHRNTLAFRVTAHMVHEIYEHVVRVVAPANVRCTNVVL